MTLTLELLPCCGHAGDDVCHVTKDGSEEEKSEEKLKDDEDVLPLAPGSRKVSDGRQSQSAPVVALKVLLHHIGRFTVTKHPIFRTEPVVFVNDPVEAAVPVKYNEEVVDEARRPEQIWVIRMAFCPVHKCPKPVDLDEPEGAED